MAQFDVPDDIRLKRGAGFGRSLCVMQAVAVVSGEGDTLHPTDAPQCSHPGVTQVMIHVNDHLVDDAERQRLKEYVPRIIGTRHMSETEWNARIDAVCDRFPGRARGERHGIKRLAVTLQFLPRDRVFEALDILLPEQKPEVPSVAEALARLEAERSFRYRVQRLIRRRSKVKVG